jgi:hypothetical protein
MRFRALVFLATLMLASAAGCESKATVTGMVTYKGEKVTSGYIDFRPVTESGDTKGATVETRGADIIDGVYKIENLTPGKRKVVISAKPTLTATKGPDGKSTVKATPPTNPIAPDARGNGEVIEFRAGEQTQDFTLEPK